MSTSSAPVTIRANAISKVYGDFVAVHGLSFEVRKGTVAAFLGPNGAGKSTTMKMLTGYLAPSSGTVELLGKDPGSSESRIALARRLGYLPENGPLYLDMTPRELLEFFGEVRKLGDIDKAIERVVEQCAIREVLHKPIGKLSKGFRQRVGMAQALLSDPDVLILDEPTSGLDPLQIREVRGLIRELGQQKTILLSTHILQEVEAVADTVIMIHEGRLVFDGSVAELRDGRSLESRFYELAGAPEAEADEQADDQADEEDS
ncbi:putative ABC transporter ATP-binding protein YxlF [Enhygromyxa salina]|uniref:Putative ABC transporter ATP-binding protein YxlF n=1 Tax=Enhygromyxa salina TaxID=215803 RepID=A0A2S9XXJ4_9BACT|nr:ATP-binding cassette domain-containing protein [Enhygromyxa salina]PRP97450.1 putative ABC transporter ATP-binding protein YxlF [Enhygromyxa salina]